MYMDSWLHPYADNVAIASVVIPFLRAPPAFFEGVVGSPVAVTEAGFRMMQSVACDSKRLPQPDLVRVMPGN